MYRSLAIALLLLGAKEPAALLADSPSAATQSSDRAPAIDPPPRAAEMQLGEQKWRVLDGATDRALAWLITQQAGDGSFKTYETGQPAVSALVVLAFMARGHLPGEGPYGKELDRAVQFLLDSQFPDGLLARAYPDMPIEDINPTHTSSYNHAITGLCLSELYSLGDERTSRQIQSIIERAISYTAKRIPVPKRVPEDEGGWRYGQYKSEPPDSDLSITSWQLMFLRSSRNAGFRIPPDLVEGALVYVRRLYDPRTGCFMYGLSGVTRRTTRAMTGAGILSLSLGGHHGTNEALRAGGWLLQHPPGEFQGDFGDFNHRYYYDLFYSSQAMFQLGGNFWKAFFPRLIEVLVARQRPDGSWEPDPHRQDRVFGSVYSTALAVLALTPPYQVLPIFQR